LLTCSRRQGAEQLAGRRADAVRIIPKKVPSLSGNIGRYLYEVRIPLRRRWNRGTGEISSRASVIVSREESRRTYGRALNRSRSPGGIREINIVLVDQDQLKPRIGMSSSNCSASIGAGDALQHQAQGRIAGRTGDKPDGCIGLLAAGQIGVLRLYDLSSVSVTRVVVHTSRSGSLSAHRVLVGPPAGIASRGIQGRPSLHRHVFYDIP
jgi:hypothetical protein